LRSISYGEEFMKIRTRFMICMVIFFVAFLVIGHSIITSSREIEQLNNRMDLAIRIQMDAYDLSQLSTDYVLNHDMRPQIQWHAKFATLTQDVAALNAVTPQEQALLTSIRSDQQLLNETFSQVAGAIDASEAEGDNPAGDALVTASWSRMAIPNQKIVFEASQLVKLIEDEADCVQQQNMLLMYLVAGLTLALLVVNFFLIFRNFLRSIGELESGIRIIGSGNLDFRIPEKGDDEFRDLARSFNAMAESRNLADMNLLQEIERTRAANDRLAAAEKERENLIQELQRKNTELDRFTYTVSHDLKSPLLSIRAYASLLEGDLKSENTERADMDIVRISESAEKLENLITTLLALSRSGRSVDFPVQIPFADLTREAVALLDNPVRERGIRLEIPASMPEFYGDRQRLVQVMTNLLDNAVKFMGDQKDPRIEVSVRSDAGSPVICVQDNGMGIKKENLGKVFGLYERFNPDIPGTGIGLATVKRIIEAHGGKIWVESEGEGKGTTVCFTLPEHANGEIRQ
jgi:signal transduction histidine kinase